MKQIKHWIQKQLYGECDECHQILEWEPKWGRSYCSKCGKHWSTL